MARDGLTRVLEAIVRQPEQPLADRICSAGVALLDAVGVSISLNGTGHHQTVSGTSRGIAGDRMQMDLGEGPGYDVHRDGRPVMATDLTADGAWPAFAPAAVTAGFLAAFAFPLRSGAVRVGSLNVYRDRVGGLEDQQYRDGLTLAMIAHELLVSLQGDVLPSQLPELLADTGRETWEVHQASGMVAVQAGVSVADARALLRARAYAEERPLSEIAADIVARRIRLDDPGGEDV